MSDDLSAAIDAVVARFATMVRSVGARHRLAESDLDDVVQDVRIRLWKAGGTSEQIRALGASYVYRTATTAALDLLRRRRAHGAGRTEAVDDMPDLLVSPTGNPEEALALDALARRVATAIDAIPASRRPVVRMYLDGYDRLEIGDLLGWSEAKTRNLLYRGLADLRERLGDET